MKKSSIRLLVGLAAAAGLMVAGSPAARAEGADVHVGPSNILASGTYHVIINRTGVNHFHVFVTGDPNGRTVPGPDPGTAPVKHSVGQISIGFLGMGGVFIPPTFGNGDTDSGGAFTGAPWSANIVADNQRFNSPGVGNDVGPFGENAFRGGVTLANNEMIERFNITLQDGNQQWFIQAPTCDITNVPEPASLALVLPGLAPLAMMVLRRRPRRNGAPEEEEPATPSS